MITLGKDATILLFEKQRSIVEYSVQQQFDKAQLVLDLTLIGVVTIKPGMRCTSVTKVP